MWGGNSEYDKVKEQEYITHHFAEFEQKTGVFFLKSRRIYPI